MEARRDKHILSRLRQKEAPEIKNSSIIRGIINANDRKHNTTVLNNQSESIDSAIDKSGARAVFRLQGCSRSFVDVQIYFPSLGSTLKCFCQALCVEICLSETSK